MKKLLILALLVMVLLFAIPSYAAEEAPPTAETATTSAPISTMAPSADAPTEAPGEETLVSEISAVLKDWVPELLSGASLVASVVLAYLFKKGLLPGVAKILSHIKSAVSTYNETVEKVLAEVAAERQDLKETTEVLLEKIRIREEDIQVTLNAASKILLAQSDSLFDLLEHTNLPAAEKAAIAAKHKEQLAEIAQMVGSYEE